MACLQSIKISACLKRSEVFIRATDVVVLTITYSLLHKNCNLVFFMPIITELSLSASLDSS